MDTDESETVVEGVIDETSMFFGHFARKEGFTMTFEMVDVNPEIMDILMGTDTRTIEGEIVQGELTSGK